MLKGNNNVTKTEYTMLIGVVPNIEPVIVQAFDVNDWWLYCLIVVTLVVSLGLTAVCVF